MTGGAALLGAGLLALSLLPARAAEPAPAPPPALRVLVLSAGLQPVLVRGLWTVDGTARLVAPGFTPMEFTAKPGSVVSGYFEVAGHGGGELTVRVFDPTSSRLYAVARSASLPAARVAWAPEGAGPRCADGKKVRCPETVAGREAMVALQQAAPVPVPPAPRDTYDALVERVRSEPAPRPDAPDFPPLGIIGMRAGTWWGFGAATTDPMMPNTLDEHFPHWQIAARASLLLQYARLATEPETLPVPEGFPAELAEAWTAERAQERRRVRQLLRGRPYEEAWRPFLEPYRGFREAVAQVRPGQEGMDQGVETWTAIDRIARARGLYRFVVDLPIEPTDVADEMLRLAAPWRVGEGVAAGTGPFYPCESGRKGERLAVRVHLWHPLAPAFARAVQAIEDGVDDPRAREIVAAWRALEDELNAWAAEHPGGDTLAQARALQDLAAKNGLAALLEAYGGATSP